MDFANFIVHNAADITKDVFFAFFGLALGFIFTPKNNGVQNGTSINQTIQFISNNVTSTVHVNRPHKGKRRNSPNDGNDEMALWLVGLLLLAFFYMKYHSALMSYMTSVIIMGLVSTITVAIRLHITNNYDNLNKLWTGLLLMINVVNIISLGFMTTQTIGLSNITSVSSFIESVGMDGVFKSGYYAVGFVTAQLPNLFMLILLVHMFAVNMNKATGGRISAYIIRKTYRFTLKPNHALFSALIISIISLAFTSGFLYDLVSKQKPLEAFLRTFSGG